MGQDRRDKRVLAQWVQEQRGRPQIKPAPKVGHAVNRVLRPFSKTFPAASSVKRLKDLWEELVGARWSKISIPSRIVSGRKGRTLVIEAPGPAAALIMASSGPILDRINSHMGDNYIQALKVEQRAIEKNKTETAPQSSPEIDPESLQELQDSLSNLDNPRLKTALEALGRNVLAKKR